MTDFWFLVPAHGRFDLAAVCLRQLRRTCDTLTAAGLAANAVVVADDKNLAVAENLGFATVDCPNHPLGRKWNDAYELACRHGGAKWVAPLGSDDWIDAEFILAGLLPESGQIRCARLSAVVSPDGCWATALRIPYPGGDGVRIWDTSLLERVDYRPADEDVDRAIDTRALERVTRRGGKPDLVYFDLHPWQIVDWKSDDDQLNSYDGCLTYADGPPQPNPLSFLAQWYPVEALHEMRDLKQAVAA